jgi:putative sigma-54 modulation protein
MDVSITARNIDVDANVKKYIVKKLQKIEKLYRRIYKCEVILEEEKERKSVEIILFLKSTRMFAKNTSTDILESIDLASDKIKAQLRRLNDRVSSRRKRRSVLGRMLARGSGFEDAMELPETQTYGDITKTDLFADKPMLPEEARLELENGGMDFIMFKNSDTGEVNVLYRRSGGGFGLIEPRF